MVDGGSSGDSSCSPREIGSSGTRRSTSGGSSHYTLEPEEPSEWRHCVLCFKTCCVPPGRRWECGRCSAVMRPGRAYEFIRQKPGEVELGDHRAGEWSWLPEGVYRDQDGRLIVEPRPGGGETQHGPGRSELRRELKTIRTFQARPAQDVPVTMESRHLGRMVCDYRTVNHVPRPGRCQLQSVSTEPEVDWDQVDWHRFVDDVAVGGTSSGPEPEVPKTAATYPCSAEPQEEPQGHEEPLPAYRTMLGKGRSWWREWAAAGWKLKLAVGTAVLMMMSPLGCMLHLGDHVVRGWDYLTEEVEAECGPLGWPRGPPVCQCPVIGGDPLDTVESTSGTETPPGWAERMRSTWRDGKLAVHYDLGLVWYLTCWSLVGIAVLKRLLG